MTPSPVDVLQYERPSYLESARLSDAKDDEDITKKLPDKPQHNHFTPTQLRNLIHAAQKGEQHAIDTLCKAFEPLIYKEATCGNIYATLGEDAVNTAWEIFLETIQNYHKPSYRLLPGFIKKRIHYTLLQKICRTHSVDTQESLENLQEQSIAIHSEKDTFADSDDKMQLESLLKQLTPLQRAILEKLELQGMSAEAAAQSYGYSVQAIYQAKRRAIAELRRITQKKPADSSTIHRHEKQKLA